MNKIRVSIIILNYNGKKDTLACLDSIGKLDSSGMDVSVIVVDNASRDGSVLEIKNNYPQTEILTLDHNYGFCKANNIGAKKAYGAGAEYILILNNDTVVKDNFLLELIKATEREKSGIASPKIYFFPGCEFHKERYKKQDLGKVIWYAGGRIDWDNVLPRHRGVDEVDIGQFDRSQTTEFVTGCALLLNRKVYEKIGLFDEIYFAYFEDADFSLRAKRHGLKMLYVPSAILYHKNAASFGGSGSAFQDYFMTRNRIIFGLKYAPVRVKLALMRQSMGYLLGSSGIRRQAVVDALTRRLSPPQPPG